MERLSFLSASVKWYASQFPANTFYDKDDVEQELWVKLLEVMPRFKSVSDEEVLNIARVILKNKVTDIVRMCRRRIVDGVDITTLEDSLRNSFLSITNYRPLHCFEPDEVSQYKRLINDIKSWSESRCTLTRKLVKEMLEPSDATLLAWEEICSISPMYKQYDMIPPSSFHKIFGVHKNRIRSILLELREYLVALEYRQGARA